MQGTSTDLLTGTVIPSGFIANGIYKHYLFPIMNAQLVTCHIDKTGHLSLVVASFKASNTIKYTCLKILQHQHSYVGT